MRKEAKHLYQKAIDSLTLSIELFNRPNDCGRIHGGQERQHTTAVWRNGGFSPSYDSFVVGSSVVLRLNFCSENPPLRQAPKR